MILGTANPASLRRTGFSLLELVMVVSILAIITSIAAPRYGAAIARYRLDSAARRVAADIEQTRALARARGSNETISFLPSKGSYSIAGIRVGNSKSAVYTVKLGEPPYSVTVQSADFTGTPDLTFGGFGLPSSAGIVTLRSGSEIRTISIDAESGSVTIN